MRRLTLLCAAFVLVCGHARAQYIDGLPAASAANPNDLLVIDQGAQPLGSGYLPGSGTVRSITVHNLLAGVATFGTFTSTVNGLVPASGGGTANYLRADGTWDTPPGGAVQSVFGRTGNVALLSSDISSALGFTPPNPLSSATVSGSWTFSSTLSGHASLDLPLSGGTIAGALGLAQVGTPSAPASGGTLYVDSNNALHFENSTTDRLLSGGISSQSVSSAVTANGTSQGTATLLTSNIDVVTTAAANAGVVLPSVIGAVFRIFDQSVNAITVYPPSNATIDGNAVNVGMSVPSGSHYAIVCYSSTACLSVN